PAHELAARELWVEHSAGGEDAEHAPNTYEAQVGIGSDLRELGAERQQPVRGVERRRPPATDRFGVGPSVATEQIGIALADILFVAQRESPILDVDRARIGTMERGLLVGDGQVDDLLAQVVRR